MAPGKSPPTTPTRRTFEKYEADIAKYVAEPPTLSSRSAWGVMIQSMATLPTTSRCGDELCMQTFECEEMSQRMPF